MSCLPQSDGGGGVRPHGFPLWKGYTMSIANQLREAITDAITKNVRHQGSWITETLSGIEFTFRMNDTGAIGVYLQDEDGEEQEYCFRLEVVED